MNEDIAEELERNLQTQFEAQKSGQMLKIKENYIKEF
jgi:hypothetical protein